MNDFYEFANQVNTIAVFEIIVIACLWVIYDMLKNSVRYIVRIVGELRNKKAE